MRISNPETIQRVRMRDGICLAGLILKDGCVEGFDVHHIASRGSGGDDVLSNLICLCRKHHEMAHSGEITRGNLYEILRFYWNYNYDEDQINEL
jgi:hypothetical protein